MTLEFRNITKRYKGKTALDELSLTVERESFTVLCGPPQSGKSTLFRIFVGLEKADSGEMLLSGRDISKDTPADRPIGYIPQNFALYPHQTVAQNIAYPLTLAGFPKDEIAKRVDRTAGILSITHLMKKTPDQLSGGEKQRVAVARGLLKDAEIFVLDDPLVGLDYKLRERLMDELKSLRQELKATFLYATSDSLEALTMAQRLAVIDAGRIVQVDSVDTVYHNPSHARSLDLVGFPHANLIAGRVAGGFVQAGPWRLPVQGLADGSEVIVGLRPEHIRLLEPGDASAASNEVKIPARVSLVENQGGEIVVNLDADGQPLTLALLAMGAWIPELDSSVTIAVDPKNALFFDGKSRERLMTGGHA
ncbi:ABC transporter ATP-binding protein [Mesorhizobium sp. SB112]|uniref:ABC transporter ATP-binding protein n=1 Tax=Mesorhizobium sp. SB112 TaxID=3151853 RepID=UPI003264EACA